MPAPLRRSTFQKPFTFRGHGGHTLAGRLELPGGRPKGTALFAHCFTCGKDIAAAGRISRALGQHGWAVLRFDFTGLGGSEGDFANTDFSSNVGDLKAAADALSEAGLPVNLLVGHSLGGAAVLAAAPRIAGVQAVATVGAPFQPAHVTHLFEDSKDTIQTEGSACVQIGPNRFRIAKGFLDDVAEHDQRDSLANFPAAALILHSPTDSIVNISEASRIYRALPHPKSFVSLDGADHLLSQERDAGYAAGVIAAWAERYIPDGEEPPAEKGEVRVATSGTPYAQTVRTDRHGWLADEPRSLGGKDTAPSPYELLLSALGSCTNVTLQMYAGRKEWPLEGVITTLTHTRQPKESSEKGSGQGPGSERITRSIELEGPLDAPQKERLMEIANRCPIHRTLEGGIEIETAGA